MIIQILSDLHIEMGFNPLNIPFHPAADLVILAGDIFNFSLPYCDLDNIKNQLESLSIPVIYVPGNHEYYGNSLTNFKKKITDIFCKPNHHFLDNKTVTINGVKFIGSTLWSNFDLADNLQDFSTLVNKGINDFRYIEKFTPSKCIELNKVSRKFLEKELNTDSQVKFVVTHFVPTAKAVAPQFIGNSLNPYFVCSCDKLISKANYWVFGHTHSSFDFEHLGCKMICNPHGYGHENRNWEQYKFIEIGV